MIGRRRWNVSYNSSPLHHKASLEHRSTNQSGWSSAKTDPVCCLLSRWVSGELCVRRRRSWGAGRPSRPRPCSTRRPPGSTATLAGWLRRVRPSPRCQTSTTSPCSTETETGSARWVTSFHFPIAINRKVSWVNSRSISFQLLFWPCAICNFTSYLLCFYIICKEQSFLCGNILFCFYIFTWTFQTIT